MIRVARLLEVDTPENPAETWEFENGVAVFDFTPRPTGCRVTTGTFELRRWQTDHESRRV